MAFRAATSGLTRSLRARMTGPQGRKMSIWAPLTYKPCNVKAQQIEYLSHNGPTYLRGTSTDGMVALGGIAGITLVFVRVMFGYVDMSHGTNKIEVQ